MVAVSAWPAATLRGGGLERNMLRSVAGQKLPKDLLDHPCIRIRFGKRRALLDCTVEKAGRVVKVSPQAK